MIYNYSQFLKIVFVIWVGKCINDLKKKRKINTNMTLGPTTPESESKVSANCANGPVSIE